jgi:L-fucose isomerase-like protein
MEDRPLDTGESVARFIDHVKSSCVDGLFLVPFKKSHWEHVVHIVKETEIPTVILATLGVVLIGHVREMARQPGVFVISSQDDFEAVRSGLRMIKTAHRMSEALILDIAGSTTTEQVVPLIGTKVRTVPHEIFYERYKRLDTNDAVHRLANAYWDNAKDVVEPTKGDVLEAARAYFVFKDLLEAESADAIMMDCLPGLKRPHKHVPPCMGFMSLRDEGVPMGCESDLDATVTLMLLQQLCAKPGFQHNPSVDSERNHYFCAHCTSASKMRGLDQPSEPYILRNHAEAGWGCVPRVLMTEAQEVTIAKYLSSKSGERPQMLLYSGTIVGCPPIPPTGGCRTNVETTINELDDVYELKGHHLCLIYGDHAKQLKAFCQLYDIEVVV